eukprot:3299473-Alexandrium_andersonii.AAC.1
MAGRVQPSKPPWSFRSAAAQRTRDGLAAALLIVGPIPAMLLALTLPTCCLLWRAATSWSSTACRVVLARVARREPLAARR